MRFARQGRLTHIFALLAALGPICAGLPRPGADSSVRTGIQAPSPEASARKLKGRFLHITDVHPDPFYKVYSSTEQEKACHRGSGPAGYYGAETSDCDSPIALLNETFKWIKHNLKDDIDFVIWTGDSARHDNDEKIPRSDKQVISQNELLVDRFLDVFGKPENYDDDDPTNDFVIPIIPTFGNNDILPHNIFREGPNPWTRKYLDIWRQFIPEAQRHQFQRGGWFYVEVIPDKLAVFSLNTLYFFASNSAVDGCAAKSEPGYEHMEWLRIQLDQLRHRGMKAILTGHVPPARVDSKTSWDETCWQKYALWQKQYRDVILTSLYGHMNIDHFMLQDFKDIKKHVKKGLAISVTKTHQDEAELTTQASADYLVDLRDTFSQIPDVISSVQSSDSRLRSWAQAVISRFKPGKETNPYSAIGGPYGERYSLSLVQASVVPNYFPTLRVYEYNFTGLESVSLPDYRLPRNNGVAVAKSPGNQDKGSKRDKHKHKDKDESLRKPKRHKFTVPNPPSKSSPPGPAYSPQTLTLLGYTQYYANLTYLNHDFHNDTGEDVDTMRWKDGKHRGKMPKHTKPSPMPFGFDVEYSTLDDKIYKLKDLTVRSYLQLARQMASPGGNAVVEQAVTDRDQDVQDAELDLEKKHKKKGKKHRHKDNKRRKKKINKVWFTFIRRAFVGTMELDDIEDRFGGAEHVYADTDEPTLDDGTLEL